VAIPTWKVAPALLSGCAAVLKPSPLTPLTAALVVQAIADAGQPDGVLNLVQGDREAGEALVADPRVAGVSFTGSLSVGQAIALDAITVGAFGQSGQRCSATSRVIVDRAVHDELLSRLTPRVSRMRVGRGDQEWADIGPVVNDARRQSGTIFTRDPALMFQSLRDFQAGMLHVNRPGVGAYSHLPHVGAKASQLGPPECSPEVWNFYTELRSACIRY
jgi:acyl-CoA reductase-like NAD-dependent aldehyde dehydrogenase